MEAKFGTLEKRIKRLTSNFFFLNSRVPSFWLQKEERNFGRAEVEPVDEKLKKIQIKLATTCNKNEQQQDAKNNAEL
jgi:hypothetical protein